MAKSDDLRLGLAMAKKEERAVISAEDVRSERNRSWSEMQVQILEAARHLIADEGYHNFSMRGIAQGSGIHLKSLQYYFRTKREMLSAVVDYTIEKYYFQPYDKLFEERSAGTPSERFNVMLDYLLDDLSNEFTAKLFPELWALANHDSDVAEALDVFYCRHVASIKSMVEQINPSLASRVAGNRAALIAMMIEGLLLILGHGKPKHSQYLDLKASAKETIFQIVTAPVAGSRLPLGRSKRISRAKTAQRSQKL